MLPSASTCVCACPYEQGLAFKDMVHSMATAFDSSPLSHPSRMFGLPPTEPLTTAVFFLGVSKAGAAPFFTLSLHPTTTTTTTSAIVAASLNNMTGRYRNRPRDRNRLPNLAEILNRRTHAPVDLWSFYIYLREQQRAVEYLDFWLDVVQHLSLCKHYVRGLRQSILANSEHHSSSRTSSLLDTLIQEGTLDDTDSHRLSMFLRGEDAPGSGALYRLSALLDAMSLKEQGLDELHSAMGTSRNEKFIDRVSQAHDSMSTFDNYEKHLLPRSNTDHSNLNRQSQPYSVESHYEDASFYDDHLRSQNGDEYYPSSPVKTSSLGQGPLLATSEAPNTASNGLAFTTGPGGAIVAPSAAETIERLFPRRDNDVTDGSNFVTRQNIRQSSHRILVTYFIPGAERELQLPPRIIKAVKNAIEVDGRDDPEVFDEAREYVFQAMERDALPGFLATRALSNTSTAGSLVRLVVGLFSLFAAFWVAFILIFLDWKPKATRCWLILPFGVGVYLTLASLFNLDPLMAICGYTESPQRNGFLLRIREPYIRRVLISRSLYVLFVIILCAAILVIIFALVPGKRL